MTPDKICERHARNVSDRTSIEWVYRDCYAMTMPIRGARWWTGADTTKGSAELSLGKALQDALLDETGADGARILAAGLKDGGCPATSRWFGLDVDGVGDGARLWLDKSADRLWRLIHNSNFDAVVFEALLDEVIGGQFVLYVDEDPVEGGFQFEQWPTADCTWAQSRQGGRIDMIWREFVITAEQCVADYPGRCPQAIEERAAKEPSSPVTMLRYIGPREGTPGRFALNMPFESITLIKEHKHVVRESGYPRFPCVVPRWMTIPGSVFAVGPAYGVLGAMRQLNEITRMQMLGLEVHAGVGTYKAKDDGVFNPRTVKLGSRRVIVVGDMDNLQPLSQAGDMQATLLDMERLQRAIRKGFLADALEPQDTGVKTATEIQVRVDMIRQQLGPMYGRLQSEFLIPFVELCFAMALERGAFEAVPQELARRPFRVKFLSPLARAQQLQDVVAIDQYVTGTLVDVQLDPSVADNVDMAELNRIRAERLGLPREGLRDREKVRQLQDARARAQARQQAEALQVTAAGAQDAGQRNTAAAAAGAARGRMVAA